ncbi:hypothetical protein [Pantoea phage vB_PagP-SK1]|uniref:Uncharacterized protein n=1 Tax=Pantoea phage vB_PagP-SK1 TaxID=2653646 RepID=A0A5P8NK55_9CAUD|nr:hypothetical protein [Pantoea phage vB_PagP-SK1]
MLKPIKHLLDNPNDVPDVPRAVKEYLQSSFNHTFLNHSGIIKKLRQSGCSESYILGVIDGFGMASAILDEMETRKEMNQEG